jgi:lipoate---protein ligase
MTNTKIRKVPGGKLLRVTSLINNGIIESISIHGDFFIHPEEAVYIIENSLVGTSVKRNQLRLLLSGIIRANNIEIVGFAIEDLIDCIMSESTPDIHGASFTDHSNS